MDTGVKEELTKQELTATRLIQVQLMLQNRLSWLRDLIAQGVDAICVVPVDMEIHGLYIKESKDAGIVVITREGADLKNVDYDIEAFS